MQAKAPVCRYDPAVCPCLARLVEVLLECIEHAGKRLLHRSGAGLIGLPEGGRPAVKEPQHTLMYHRLHVNFPLLCSLVQLFPVGLWDVFQLGLNTIKEVLEHTNLVGT